MEEIKYKLKMITEYYNYIFYDLADPRTKDWLLLGSPLLPATLIGFYLFLTYSWSPKFMEKRKPYSLKTIIQLYNIFQITACIVILYFVFTTGKSNYWFGCYSTDYSQDPLALRILYCGWSTHILKIIELMETVLFILRKKYRQVSKLHVYHHTASYVLSWVGVKYVGGGSSATPAFFNSFIHVIMYSYYLLSASGPKMQAKLAGMKPIITIIQMVQLCIIIVQGTMPFRSDCDLPLLVAWIYIPNVVVFLALFLNFYIQNYVGKHKKET